MVEYDCTKRNMTVHSFGTHGVHLRKEIAAVFYLDYKSGLPIYEQLYRSVTKMAAAGALEKDEKLPAVRSLAVELGINPNTVQKAYQMLERDGVIYSVPGKGSFIAGETQAVEQQQALAREKLHEAIGFALDCGFAAETLQQICEQYIHERGVEAV